MTQDVNILFCANTSYLQHACVCLASILHNNPHLNFNVVIVLSSLDESSKRALQKSVHHFENAAIKFQIFSPPRDKIPPIAAGSHYSLDTWSRLWISDFFSPAVSRVLYLDSDMVVVGDIAPLWNVNLDEALLGAVPIPGSQRGVLMHGLREEDGYFNAGVLLIDLERWRATGALERVLSYVRAYPERLPDVDQDALNACFHSVTKRLDYTWNAIWPFFREPLALPLPRAEIERVRKDANIIHFNGISKPWSYFCDHPRKDEYEKYLRMTEWRNFVPPDRTTANVIRKHTSKILPRKIKSMIKNRLGLA